jgi:tetratricopeptide (TPR) repeat protein
MALAKAEDALAKQNVEEAIQLAKESKSKDPSTEAAALGIMVEAYLIADEGVQARKAAKEMLSAAQNKGDQALEGKAWTALANVYLTIGESPTDAMEAADKAKSIFSDLKDMKGQAGALTTAAKTFVAMERTQAAMDAAKEAVSLARDTGDTKAMASALEVLVQACALQANPMAGLKAANKELTALEASGNEKGQAQVLEMIANTHATLGEPYGAIKAASKALSLYEKLGDVMGQGTMLHVLAEMKRAQGDKAAATAMAEKSLKIFKGIGAAGAEEMVLETLSSLLVESGYPEKAPKRKDAIRTLKDMVKAIEKRDADALKTAEDKVAKVSSLLVDQDYADILHPMLHADSGAVSFLEEQGWVFKKENAGATYIRTFPHRAFYLHMIMTGMGFGPQFRAVNPARVQMAGGKTGQAGVPLAISVSQCAETEAWQMEMGYRPGILDSGLQVQGVLNFP